MARAKAGPKGKALVKWDEELAKYAEEAASGEARGPGQMITIRGGVMMFNGAAIDDNTLNAVVIDHIKVNAFYAGEFDPDSPQPPICYAYGRDKEEMAPHEEATEPQAETCEECPNNQWGSANKGRGKACKNTRRLALIATDSLDDIENAPVAFMHPPVTSVATWSQYVNKLAETAHRPPFAFVTEIQCLADPKSQFRLQFKAIEQFDDADTFEALIQKREEAASAIMFAYPKVVEEEKPAPRRGGRQQAKPARGGKPAGVVARGGRGMDKDVKRGKPAAKTSLRGGRAKY